MTEQEAIALLRSLGYRVTKSKARASRRRLNAVGKPYGSNYDPNYRRKMQLTSIRRLYAPMPYDTKWVEA